MTVWLVIVAAGLGSYLLRISMLVVAERFGLPPVLERIARLAVPTAFAALAVSSLASRAAWNLAFLPPVLAVAVGVVAVKRTGSPHAAILAGMPTLWAVSLLVGT